MSRLFSFRAMNPAAATLAAIVTGLTTGSVTMVPRPAQAEQVQEARKSPVRVTTIDVDGSGQTAFVRIRGWKDPSFTVFRLEQPDRVVVDLRNADLSELAAKGALTGRGPVVSVTPKHFADDQGTVGRVTIETVRGARYDVRSEGNDLVVEFRAEGTQPTLAKATEAAPKAEARRPEAPTAPAGDNIVRVEVDRLPNKTKSGTKILSAKLSKQGQHAVLQLKTDGPIASYQIMELKEPGRLALDLDGFTQGTKASATSVGPITDLRIARREGAVRVVLEAKGDRFPPFEITRVKNGLQVRVSPVDSKLVAEASKTPVETAAPAAKAEEKQAAPVTTAVVAKSAPAKTEKVEEARGVEVDSIDLSGTGRMSRVIVALNGEASYDEQTLPDGRRLLVLKNATLPKSLERRLDASSLEGPIDSLAAYTNPKDGTVRLVADLKSSEIEAVGAVAMHRMGKSVGLEWKFTGVAPRRLMASNTTASAVRAKGPGGFMGEAPAYARTAGPRASEGRYTGKRVDFTAKDLDILQFLNAIAEVAKRNIVADEGVTGKVTIRLRNVPWDEALDIVLRTKGLSTEEIGSIIRVAPLKLLEEEAAAKAQAEITRQGFAPLKVRLIPVNYTTADAVAGQVRDLLTKDRGTLSIDARTNVLIVKDVPEVIAKAELLVRNLDLPTPQVLIEARIVEASATFSRSLGIQWGGDVRASPATGNPTGLVFPNLVSVSGAADDGRAPISGVSQIPNFVVNMPTPVGVGTGGGVGFIFGSAGGAANLNLRLTAAELGGTVKTVSAPKAVTLDNTAATISQGVSIPFSQVSAAGANTAFIEARLQLSVTPHVTADGSVLLKINVTNNQPNPGLTGSNGQPSLLRREASTNVLVKDGDTTVIGGIYTRRTAMSDTQVPFFSKIPILGALFRQNNETDDRTEMLIFVSPRIINRQQSVVAGGDMGFDANK